MRRAKLSELVLAMLRVGVIGFGGGAALIPVMEDELVHRRGLLTPKQFGAHTLIANLTPGALPVKLAALAGAELGRPGGAVLAAGAVALPGALASVALLAGFASLGPAGVRVVEFASVGISAFIIVLLAGFITKTLRGSGQRLLIATALMLTTFLLTGGSAAVRVAGGLFGQQWNLALPRLSAVQVVLGAAAAISVAHLLTRKRASSASLASDPSSSSRAVWTACGWFVFLVVATIGVAATLPSAARFLSLIALSSVTSFGGGEAYVAVADGFFVQGGMVSGSEFYGQAVPIANALPGPILVKIASSLGLLFGLETGWPTAIALSLATFLVAVGASCAPAMALLAGHAKVARSRYIRILGNYILPVICGLLLTTSVAMLATNMAIGESTGVSASAVGWATIVAVAVLWVLRQRFGVPDLLLLLGVGALSCAALLAL